MCARTEEVQTVTLEPARPSERSSRLARLLRSARFEVIPATGATEKVRGALPSGTTVTVTCSPQRGIDRSLDVAVDLSAAGFAVVPHLAARMVSGRDHLKRILERLESANIHEAFVVGGDATVPVGTFRDAGDLLDALASLPHSLDHIGVGGYPEGHPLVREAALLEALRRKQPYAHYIVTQLCFDSDALTRWISSIREAGITLPVVVGLPGCVERRKLAEVSLQVGVGASLRYLARHRRQLVALARSRTYDPTALAGAIATHLDEPDLRLRGAHLFTFNQVEATQSWLRGALLLQM
jgi:methylenetetrahydrofolate reductase (NADPH)